VREFFVGCCGWAVRGGRDAYFKKFRTVEVQETFYKLPRVETVKKWREEAPEGFIFCMKAWQGVSHPVTSPTWRRSGMKPDELRNKKYGFLRPVRENFMAWEKTMEVAKAMAAELVVIQTPPTMTADEKTVKNALEFLSHASSYGVRVGWEPRGELAKKTETIRKICIETGVVHVVDLLRTEPSTVTDILYTRLHGLGGREVNYSYRYTDEDLRNLATKVFSFNVRKSFIMFNNISMAEDAGRFMKIAKLEAPKDPHTS